MTSIFWHRRDLRLEDNAGLFYALKSGDQIQPVFIFDSNILSQLSQDDQRVLFIHQEISKLKSAYESLGSDLKIYVGDPIEIIPTLALENNAHSVFTNADYEPYAIIRDESILQILKSEKIDFKAFKDHVIFEKNEVSKANGEPYTVFTPYAKKWKENLNEYYLRSYPTEKYFSNLVKTEPVKIIGLKELGFLEDQRLEFPEQGVNESIIHNYHSSRNFPAISGTSRLSLHLRFGTISIRKLSRIAWKINEKFLHELIWRDFYQMIIFHFPHSAKDSFKKQYDRIDYQHNEIHFKAWCEGKTGYPLVDAGMRELNETGFMHNRVRMVVASFLTKHLLLDWRLGEAYFAGKLLDYDLASNVGGWQWTAGCGCDAAPYFRVFNPTAQQEKFDKDLKYIQKWVEEFGTKEYPKPIIEHKFARERVLQRYKKALNY